MNTCHFCLSIKKTTALNMKNKICGIQECCLTFRHEHYVCNNCNEAIDNNVQYLILLRNWTIKKLMITIILNRVHESKLNVIKESK